MDETALLSILARHRRVAIVGGPGAGKTTLAAGIAGRPVFHTDSMMDTVSWKYQPDYWLHRTENESIFVIEGIHTARYLRKARRLGYPCPVDAVIILPGSHVKLTGAQARARTAVWTVFDEWLDQEPDVPIYD
jgi:hypothetical protein